MVWDLAELVLAFFAVFTVLLNAAQRRARSSGNGTLCYQGLLAGAAEVSLSIATLHLTFCVVLSLGRAALGQSEPGHHPLPPQQVPRTEQELKSASGRRWQCSTTPGFSDCCISRIAVHSE